MNTSYSYPQNHRLHIQNPLEQLAKVLGIHTGSEIADNVLFDIIKSHLSAVLTTCIDETDDEGTDPSLFRTS